MAERNETNIKQPKKRREKQKQKTHTKIHVILSR